MEAPVTRKPGGYAFSTVRVRGAVGGAVYRFGLEFDVPSELYKDTVHPVVIPQHCREDKRFFSSRIVPVAFASDISDFLTTFPFI